MGNRPRIGKTAERVDLPKVSKRVHVLDGAEKAAWVKAPVVECGGKDLKAAWRRKLDLKRTQEAKEKLAGWMQARADYHSKF